MNDKINVIIIGGDCSGLAQAIANNFNQKLATTEGASSTEGKKDFTVDLELLHQVSKKLELRKPLPEELIMELHAMPPMESILIEEKRIPSNIGAYKGYKPHPTKASDRKRFERFNKKRR